jgi:hypothetical protein
MKKLIFLLFFILFQMSYAQLEVLASHPRGQNFYIGGINALQKEMIQIVKNKELMPCARTDEKYNVKVLINADATIKYVKDFDTVNINKNKCAFDYSRKIIPALKRWMPAKEGDKYIGAIAEFEIDPFFLYYSKEDPKDNEWKSPKFKKGIQNFSSQMKEIFEKYVDQNKYKHSSVSFFINEQGIMEDFIVNGGYSEAENKNIIRDLHKIKGTWEPGTFNGNPRKYRANQMVYEESPSQYEKDVMYFKAQNL